MYLDRRMTNSVDREICEFIHEVGKEIYIQYYNKSICPYDGVDKTYKTGLNPKCSTCNGTGYIKTYNPKIVKGICNSQVQFSRFFKDKLMKPIDIVPLDSMRITVYLEDVMVNVNSAESKSFFDSCDYVRIDGNSYSVSNTKRFGIGRNFIYQVALDEIK